MKKPIKIVLLFIFWLVVGIIGIAIISGIEFQTREIIVAIIIFSVIISELRRIRMTLDRIYEDGVDLIREEVQKISNHFED